MKLMILIGNCAAGKMTVGQELTKITPFRLFHNHMMIEPVLEVFGEFRGDLIQKLRSFTENGGTLVGTYWSGLVDESDLCFESFPPCGMQVSARSSC